MSSKGFPFDDDNDIDPFSEDFDPFESGSLLEEQDFDLPPDDDDGGISRTFLMAGGFIIVAVLLGIVGVVVLILGDDGDPTAQIATERAQTNAAILNAVNATQTRQAEIDATLTVTTTLFFGDSTNTAIAAFNGTNTAVAGALDQTRTAIAFEATQTGAANLTEQANFVLSLTPPTATPLTLQAQILDQNGNPVTGITINIYADDGDGVFAPAVPATPTPTATPTLQPTVQQQPATATSTPSASATTGAPAATQAQPSGTEEAGDGAPVGANINHGPSGDIFARRAPGNPPAEPFQGGPTPTGDGDPILTITIGPDGSFQIPELAPGNYFLDIDLPPGTYTFVIGDQRVVINLISGTQQSVVELPNGAILTLIVNTVAAVTQVTATPSSTPTEDIGISPFDRTATALSNQLTLSAQPSGSPSPFILPTEIAQTGLFSDAASEATPAGLTLLAIMGVGLIAVVVVVRRLRSSL